MTAHKLRGGLPPEHVSWIAQDNMEGTLAGEPHKETCPAVKANLDHPPSSRGKTHFLQGNECLRAQQTIYGNESRL